MSFPTFRLALVLGGLVAACSPNKPPAPPDQTGGGPMCTTEAKICPDGTGVGRTGPNCEFAPCPAAGTPTDETTPPAAPDAAAAPTP